MSYVIQNFYQPTKLVVITPKLKNFLILLNLPQLLFFFKLNNLLHYKLGFFTEQNLFGLFFFKFFFNLSFKFFFFKLDRHLWGAYTNNLNKSFIFWKFNLILTLFRNKPLKFYLMAVSFKSVFNLFFLTTKTNSTTFVKKIYKNITFYNLYFIAFIWPQVSILFKFYLNFLIICNFYQLFKFYNGPFFKIYNF